MLRADHALLTERYSAAVSWVLDKHKLQVRHNTLTPYLSHLLMTSAFVLEEGVDEDTAIGALLHDCLEDQPVDVGEVERKFGARVAQIVANCTDATLEQRVGKPWKDRTRGHLKRMEGFDRDTLLVIAADKVSSLQSLVDDLHRYGSQLFQEGERGLNDLMWRYESIWEILNRRLDRSVLPGKLRSLIDSVADCVEVENSWITRGSVDGE